MSIYILTSKFWQATAVRIAILHVTVQPSLCARMHARTFPKVQHRPWSRLSQPKKSTVHAAQRDTAKCQIPVCQHSGMLRSVRKHRRHRTGERDAQKRDIRDLSELSGVRSLLGNRRTGWGLKHTERERERGSGRGQQQGRIRVMHVHMGSLVMLSSTSAALNPCYWAGISLSEQALAT
eukprot:1149915-Pelagomonas_calceolata.AAC.4